MKTIKPARKYRSPVVSEVLNKITPVEKLQTSTKMLLAARLDDLITAKGWGKSAFAEKLGKNPSEITKWLSGTHNFTIDTLAEIAIVLNIPMSDLLAYAKVQVVNKSHFSATVRGLPQSIQYVTPADQISIGPGIFILSSDDKFTPPFTPHIHE